uniref:PH domain-containing protein n=1 Tax=Cyprinodon variegatus TaxID=28743 RepID=A0A3Q2DFF6_CYPVA
MLKQSELPTQQGVSEREVQKTRRGFSSSSRLTGPSPSLSLSARSGGGLATETLPSHVSSASQSPFLSLQVITPFRRLILCAENRKEMEDWITSLKSVQSREHYETAQFNVEHFSGMHNWYACSHARPTFCNVCKDSLSGVTSHGLSCEGKRHSAPCIHTATHGNTPVGIVLLFCIR